MTRSQTSTFAGKKALVAGLGLHGGGVAAARWLAQQGALVTVTDLADESKLQPALDALADVNIQQFRLGEHVPEDFLSAVIIVANPALRPNHPLLVSAREAGRRVTSEIALFLEACPAQVIAVTGSNGKSTTTALIEQALLRGGRRALAGGNIGRSLLPEVSTLSADDWAVLELSSFQLAHLAAEYGTTLPHSWQVAVVTSFAPNHLDWHTSLAEYRDAKQQILKLQRPAQDSAPRGEPQVVIHLEPEELELWKAVARGKVLPVVADADVPPLRLLGAMNRANARCVLTVADALGVPPAASRAAVAEFASLPHRLQWVANIAGRDCYNDSAATTPESVLAAVTSFREPVWLLMGGVAKGDLTGDLPRILQEATGVAFYGKVAPQLFAAAKNLPAKSQPELAVCASFADMEAALAWCLEQSRGGDKIVLSPGCASFDQFRNFVHRGEAFAELCRRLAGA